jgi:hypothetical protein
LVVEIERIGNEFVEIHVGRTIATGAITTGSAGTARATITTTTAGSTTTVSTGATTIITARRAAALTTTAAGAALATLTTLSGRTILAAGFAFFGFLLFCFRHDF